MTTPALDMIVKRDTGTQKFDADQLNAPVTFTEFTEEGTNGETDYFYRGTLDLSQPIFQKLLGVDLRSQKETLTVQCVADESGSLASAYFDLYHTDSAYTRVWFDPSSTGSAPAAGTGGTLLEVNCSTNDTATAIATALAAAFAAHAHYDATADAETVQFIAKTAGFRGWHSSGSTGFSLTVELHGSTPGAIADVESADLLCEFNWEKDGDIQISDLFRIALQNCLRREGLGAVGLSTGRTRSGTVSIPDATSEVTVTFPLPMPTANYHISAYVKNTTDSPALTLFVGTITAQSETGFTRQLNGDTDSANYELVYTCTY